MIYVLTKDATKIVGSFSSLKTAKDLLGDNIVDNYLVLGELNMEYVSRITMVDNVYIYNNKKFWTSDITDILENYDQHTVTDILGKAVSKERFETEYYSNLSRINSIDGRPGQIQYNMEVGQEFISLFREECILTNFTKEADTSPMIIFSKLDTVINMLQIGGFREARQYLIAYRDKIRDDFLTNERIDKYIAMLNAADAIEYATEEDYFYTVPDTITQSDTAD